jgi:hypothetical protein
MAGRVLADRPTVVDICLWKLEEVVAGLVASGDRASLWVEDGKYDHFRLYAHRFCLTSKTDVQAAPDRVLLEALRLDGDSGWGWLLHQCRRTQA